MAFLLSAGSRGMKLDLLLQKIHVDKIRPYQFHSTFEFTSTLTIINNEGFKCGHELHLAVWKMGDWDVQGPPLQSASP